MTRVFIGKSDLITGPKEITNGTNGVAIRSVLGVSSDLANPRAMIHSHDVAKAHVLALDPKVKDSQNFGMMSGGVGGNTWGDLVDIVKTHSPETVKDGRLPVNGSQPTKRLLFNSSRMEEVLGINFRSYEE